jgi:Tol biopolymer transport system component
MNATRRWRSIPATMLFVPAPGRSWSWARPSGRADFVRLDAGSEWAAYVTPSLLLREGKIAEAREAVKRMPTAPRYHRDLLEACLQLRPAADLDRMAQERKPALPTEPDPETWYYQGSLFAYCGKKQAALHLLQSAVEQNYCAHENLLSDPLLAKLRTDTAFDKVLTAAGACQEAVRTADAAQEAQEGRLLLFPDIYKDKIAFMYGGDLWLASSAGGTARRITSHPGRELFPKFSPDGKWLAFTGQYDGNFNVYVMPSDGGQPKQLTYYQGQAQPLSDRMGVLNEVIGWTPDGKNVVFLSRRDCFEWLDQAAYTVSIDGGLPQPMPMDEGGLLSFSADGTKVAYNRIFRNFRQWKRYTGGMAQDITIYDIKNNVVDQVIPHTEYTDTFPMWHGNTIYFTSDRGPEHRLNLYSYDQGSKQVEQLTKFDEFDVMWPSLGPDAIIFENGGYLYTFDLQSRQPKKLTVYVNGERRIRR